MPDFKSTDVDSEAIKDASVSIDDYIKELQSISEYIKNGFMSTLSPYWQGQARDSFEQQINFLALEVVNLVTGYKEINEQLKKAGTSYEKADDSVKQILTKLPK